MRVFRYGDDAVESVNIPRRMSLTDRLDVMVYGDCAGGTAIY